MNKYIMKGEVEKVQKLCEHGFDINGPINSLGMTTLAKVCSLMDVDSEEWQIVIQQIIYISISSGADINRVDRHGRTALHYAARTGNLCAINFLAQYVEGFPVDKQDAQCNYILEVNCQTIVSQLIKMMISNAISLYREAKLH